MTYMLQAHQANQGAFFTRIISEDSAGAMVLSSLEMRTV